MRRWLVLLLALALLAAGAGCAREMAGAEKEGAYLLYFPVDSNQDVYGSALDTQPYGGEAEPGVESLMAALLQGPTQDGLISPFPRNVSLIGWEWKEDGVLHITLSEQYGDLADISLTLADYCIVLTLSQLQGVEGVEIQSHGYSVNYRSHQLLRPEEAELSAPPTTGT